MKSAIILFPGTNREIDMARAIKMASGISPDIIWHKDTHLDDNYDLIVLPGGFSFGDYLRTGAIAARSPIMNHVITAANRGVHILGVCNGFQILLEAGLLPGTLLRNRGLNFVCRNVSLRVENNKTAFTNQFSDAEIFDVPVAHHDGNYFAQDDQLKELEDENRIIFKYVSSNSSNDIPYNPNGSIRDIAGISNKTGNVVGLMPHPENAIEKLNGNQTGLTLFNSLVAQLG